MSVSSSRGVFFVHSCPRALCQHVEWTLQNVLDQDVHLVWTAQEAAPGMLRTEFAWYAAAGSASRIASALRGWEHLRFEITEETSPENDGGRWSHTPSLGIFYAQTDSFGDVVVSENRIRAALQKTNPQEIRNALDLALGTAWDEELEPFRYAGAGVAVRWLHRVS